MRETRYAIHPRERLLRLLLCASAILPLAVAVSFVPFLPSALVTALYVTGSIPAACAAFFYAVWTVGWLSTDDRLSGQMSAFERPSSVFAPLLIGDGVDVPCPYFPWSPWVAVERRHRRIAELEKAVGLGPDGRFLPEGRRYGDPRLLEDLRRAGLARTSPPPKPADAGQSVRPAYFQDFSPPQGPYPRTDEEWKKTFGKQDDAA